MDFLSETKEARRKWNNSLKVLEKKKRAVLIMVVVIKIYTWAKTHGTIHNTSHMLVKQ